MANIPGVTFRCRYDADWSMLFISDAVEPLTGWPAGVDTTSLAGAGLISSVTGALSQLPGAATSQIW